MVYLFSCNIHDASLPTSIQTTSVRLLLNLVENIFHKTSNDPEGRALLVRILRCLVAKFASLKRGLNLQEGSAAKGAAAAPAAAAPTGISSGKSSSGSEKSAAETSREAKQLLKTMILGVKTVVWSVSNSRMSLPPPAGHVSSAPVPQKGMSEGECLLVARLIKNGLHCFSIYRSGPDALPVEEKEVLDYFAGVFTVLEQGNFSQVTDLTCM